MAQPIWNTPSGNLVFPYTLSASPVAPATSLTYALISGKLPSGLTIDSAGLISGTPTTVYTDTTSVFAIRVTDNLGNFRDRIFNIIIAAIGPPTFNLPTSSNLLVTDDLEWVEYQVQYTNPDPTVEVAISLISGNLPSGLEIDSDGIIRGYCSRVTATTTYNFTLQITSITGTSTATYNIIVNLNASPIPVILNTNPPSYNNNDTDPYFGYYVGSEQNSVIGTISTLSSSVFTGSISGDTLFITNIASGTPSVGQVLSGVGIKNGTFISEIREPAQSFYIESINSTAINFTVKLGGIPPDWVVGTQIVIENATPAAYNGTWTIASLINSYEFTVVSAINPGTTTIGGIIRSYGSNYIGIYKVNINQTVASTLINADEVELNVTSVVNGVLRIGQAIFGTGVTPNTSIVGYKSGTGGIGTYYLDVPQTVASTTITTSINIGTKYFDDYFTFKVIGYDLLTSSYITGNTLQIQSITSTAIDFTLTLVSVPTSWIVGTPIIIENTVPAAYNGTWTIASLTGTTVTVTSGINPGASTFNGTVRANGYVSTSLPPGLSLNQVTGWITGNPIQPTGVTSQTYNFDVYVTNNQLLTSNVINFAIKFTDNVDDTIVWNTDANLGTINNSEISSFEISATSNVPLKYRIISGTLPPNLFLNEDGMIYGRVAYQPSNAILPLNTTTDFTFTVEAYDPSNPVVVTDTKEYTISVFQKYDQPIETVVMTATPPIDDRNNLNVLLSNLIIPDSYVYRLGDPYYGRSTNVNYQLLFGIYSSSIDDYIATLVENFYQRNITLGEIKTAIARDSSGKIIYEVVYSSIIDDLNNIKGQSISKQITWPYPINTALTNNVTVQTLYPNSLNNMRTQISSLLGSEINTYVLPTWMTSQQENGSTLGYTPAWVITYTKPGYSKIVKNNIETLWNYKLNNVNFTIDRFYVDKSSTFNYNNGAWDYVPSGVLNTVDVIQTCPSGNLPNDILASAPTVTNNISNWYVGMPLKFVGVEFGSLQQNVIYYVKSIDTTNNTFTISTESNRQTVLLVPDVGLMTATPIYSAPETPEGKFIEVYIDKKTILG
jgi:hypothetical protein